VTAPEDHEGGEPVGEVEDEVDHHRHQLGKGVRQRVLIGSVNGEGERREEMSVKTNHTTHRDGLGEVVKQDAALLDALDDGGEVVVHEDHVCALKKG